MTPPGPGPRPAMSPARWQRVKDVFHEALEKVGDERDAFLAAACAGDAALRDSVESLLRSHEGADSFLESPPLAAAVSLAEVSAESVRGRRIGPYALVREIGHGGMGEVYLAARADAQYQKQVAVKLVRHGLGGEDVRRRFRNERQILAGLEHPNIARMLDGGTTDEGVPYFVMEYVEGEPLTEYCDEKRLSTQRRLELFRTICGAVHYAHQKLVVHRDIKPGNILVTDDGAPKLLDFGIAKLVTPEPVPDQPETVAATRLMTPEYASPEQVRGEPVTTLTDVYSLGVVLYELLTGHQPYRFTSRAPHELARVICEEDPLKPSTAVGRVEELPPTEGTRPVRVTPESVSVTREGLPEKLRRRLAGDVDSIVLMALRKEPERRYRSAEALADDIQRHLNGLPVRARKSTAAYRAAKFARRHKAGVAAAALVALSLLGGIVATLRQAHVARSERARAERRFNDVRKLASSFLFEFEEAIEDLPGATTARQLVVKRALEYLSGLAQEAGGDPKLQLELAKAYDKIGGIQGNPYRSNLGDTAGALASYRKAMAIREAVTAAWPQDLEAQRDLATSYDRVGEIQTWTGESAASLESFRQGLAIRERLAARPDPPGAPPGRARRDLAVSHLKIGDALFRVGDTSGALESHRKARDLLATLVAESPKNMKARRDLSVSNSKVGEMLAEVGDTDAALAAYRDVIASCEFELSVEPDNSISRRALEITHNKAGDLLLKRGDADAALVSLGKGLAIAKQLASRDVENAQYKIDLAFTYNRVARARAASGDLDGSLADHQKALEIAEALAAADPKHTEALVEVAASHDETGDVLARKGDDRGALARYRSALALRQKLAADDPKDVDALRDLAETFGKLGDVTAGLAGRLRSPERLQEARDWYRRCVDAWADMRKKGILRKKDVGREEQAAAKIAVLAPATGQPRGLR